MGNEIDALSQAIQYATGKMKLVRHLCVLEDDRLSRRRGGRHIGDRGDHLSFGVAER